MMRTIGCCVLALFCLRTAQAATEPAQVGSAQAMRANARNLVGALTGTTSKLSKRMRAGLAKVAPDTDASRIRIDAHVYDDAVKQELAELGPHGHVVAELHVGLVDDKLVAPTRGERDAAGGQWAHAFHVYAPLAAALGSFRGLEFVGGVHRSDGLIRNETPLPSGHILEERLHITVENTTPFAPEGHTDQLLVRYHVREMRDGAPAGPGHATTLRLPRPDGVRQAQDLLRISSQSTKGEPDRGYFGVLHQARSAARQSAPEDSEHPLHKHRADLDPQ